MKFITLVVIGVLFSNTMSMIRTVSGSRVGKSHKVPNRKLEAGLDWLDNSDEEKKDNLEGDSAKKIMDLLKLAHSFRDNPNFDVNL